MEDRDYYREWWAEKEGRKKRKVFKVASVFRVFQKPKLSNAENWHPVLVLLLTSAICLGVFGILKLISKFTGH